jgi:hypothetical protein
MTYSEKLRHPKWQKKRLEVLNRDGFTCRNCWSGDKTLDVHHLIYLKGRDPWEYPLDHLLTLCHECHEEVEEDQKEQCFELGELFKLKITNTYSRQCTVALFRGAKGLDGLMYLLHELINGCKKEEDVYETLNNMFQECVNKTLEESENRFSQELPMNESDSSK